MQLAAKIIHTKSLFLLEFITSVYDLKLADRCSKCLHSERRPNDRESECAPSSARSGQPMAYVTSSSSEGTIVSPFAVALKNVLDGHAWGFQIQNPDPHTAGVMAAVNAPAGAVRHGEQLTGPRVKASEYTTLKPKLPYGRHIRTYMLSRVRSTGL